MSYTSKNAKRAQQDAAECEAAIRNATSFSAHFRKGPVESYTLHAGTLAEARAHATALNAEHGGLGRRAVVYAISANDRRFPVPATIAAS